MTFSDAHHARLDWSLNGKAGTIQPSGRYFVATGQNSCTGGSGGSGPFTQTILVLDHVVVIWETRRVGSCTITAQWALAPR